MTISGDASGGERLNLPSLPASIPIPESSDETLAKKAPSSSEFVSSLNSMVKKELNDLSKSLPGGNLGNFKLIDGAGGDITVVTGEEQDPKRPHKKRPLPTGEDGDSAKKKTRMRRTPGLQRKTWDQRAACVFAYLHPRIGHKDYHLTSELCKVSANTLRGWTSKALLIAKWVPFLDKMTAGEAAKILDLDLKFLGVDASDSVDASDFKEILVRKKLTPVIIKEGKKRVQSRPRVSKWHQQFLFVKKILDEHWENNRPVTLKIVRDQLQQHFQVAPASLDSIPIPDSLKIPEVGAKTTKNSPVKASLALKKFSDRYLSPEGKSFPTLVNTFITRAINRSGYSLRDRLLKRLLPFDWKDEFPKFADNFASFCKDAGADVVVSLSTAFIPTTPQPEILATDVIYEPSPGLTALLGFALPNRKLLRPMLVKQGAPQDSDSNDNDVYLVEDVKGNIVSKHVATYIKKLATQMCDKRIVVVLNESSQHRGEDIDVTLANHNNVKIFYIPNTLESITNVIPMYLHDELEAIMKSTFDSNIDGTSIYNTEQRLKDRMSALGKVYREAQSSTEFQVLIEKAFNKCGLNPFVDEAVLKTDMLCAIQDISQIEESLVKLEKNIQQLPKAADLLQLNLP